MSEKGHIHMVFEAHIKNRIKDTFGGVRAKKRAYVCHLGAVPPFGPWVMHFNGGINGKQKRIRGRDIR